MKMTHGIQIGVLLLGLVSQSVLASTASLFLAEARKKAAEEDLETAVFLYRKALTLNENNDVLRRELAALLMNAHIADPHSIEVVALPKLTTYHAKVPLLPREFPLGYLENGLLDSKEDELNFETLLILTQIYNKDTKEAIKTAKELLIKEPNHPAIHNLLGMGLVLEGSLELARMHFQKALALKPDFHRARINLAELELQSSQYLDAKKALEIVLKQDNNNQSAHLAMAKLAHLQGNADEEKRWLQSALKRF